MRLYICMFLCLILNTKSFAQFYTWLSDSNSTFKSFNNYTDFYNKSQGNSKSLTGNIPFRQIDFNSLNLEFRWCKKILFVTKCGTETKKIVFGPVISGEDIPGNENGFVDNYFIGISDITAFANSFSSDYTLNPNYILTSVIVDKLASKLVFLTEGLEPFTYKSHLVSPVSVKYINGFLYILDLGKQEGEGKIVILRINHTTDGSYSIDFINEINAITTNGKGFSDPRDITGYKYENGSIQSILLISDAGGVHKIFLGGDGLPTQDPIYTFKYGFDPYNSNSVYDLTEIVKIDADNSGYTVGITKWNDVISWGNLKNETSNGIDLAFANSLDKKYRPSNLAYMFSEQKWYITDYTSKIHVFTKEGKYLATGGSEGLDQENDKLFFPNGITPNPIEDTTNTFRYRYIVANHWSYKSGFKLFSPRLIIPDIQVFNRSTDDKLYFSFLTSSKWQAVEKATGVKMTKVFINGLEIDGQLWNTQITSNDQLTSYPNIFSIQPNDLLINFKRGWNNVEIQLQLDYSDKGPEVISNNTKFYWLPSLFQPGSNRVTQGNLPLRSHGTVLDSLPSHGSSCSVTSVV